MITTGDTAALKSRLHEYIEHADERHLAAIYVLVEKEMTELSPYDEATLDMLYKRVESNSQGYNVQEVMNYVQAHNPHK